MILAPLLSRRAPLLSAALLAAALSGCASSGAPATGTAPPAGRPIVRPPTAPVLRDPELRMEPGLEGVIGATQAQIAGRFGAPRLDVWEGDARKLQYIGTACVLDIYLYPTRASRDPVASFVEARRTDGRDVDKAACVRALRANRGQ